MIHAKRNDDLQYISLIWKPQIKTENMKYTMYSKIFTKY